MTRILVYGLLLLPLIFASADRSAALVSEKSEKQSHADVQILNKLIDSAQSYKDNPSNETYSQLWQDFESWIHQLSIKRIDASSLGKSCQPLVKAGLKIIDAAGSGATVKIYTFSPQALFAQSKVKQTEQQANLSRSSIETRDILIQSLDVTGQSNLPSEKRPAQ